MQCRWGAGIDVQWKSEWWWEVGEQKFFPLHELVGMGRVGMVKVGERL